MSDRRLTPFTLVLLFITAVSLAFGVWGLIQVDSAPPAHIAGPAFDNAARDDGPDRADDRAPDRPRNPRPAPDRPRENTGGANPDTNAGNPRPAYDSSPVVSDPSDKGEGKLTGTVRFSDGKPVPNVQVSLTRTDLNIPYPSWEGMDPELNRRNQNEYYREVSRQTRMTTTNAEGRFAFAGLDESRSYQAYAGSKEHGFNSVTNVTPGEDVNIWLLPRVTLRGTVKREDGTPVDRFQVEVRLKQGEGWNSVGTEQFDAAKGEFRTGAQVGKCRIVVTSEGLAMKGAPEVDVTEAGGQVDIVMGQAATLAGTLTGKGGEPLKGASVQVNVVTADGEGNGGRRDMRWFGGLGGFNGPFWHDDNSGGYWANTDNRGRYRITGIVPGEYSIVATFGAGNETRKAVLNPGANVQDFALDAGCMATVKVTDPKGKPVLSAWVYFMAPDGNYLNTVGMPQQKPGEYIYGGMPPGKCAMQVGAQGYPNWKKDVELKAGDNRFEVQLAEGAFLEGRVTTSAGAGVREHYVRIGKPGKISDDDWQDGMYTQTDAKGAFRLGPVEPGDYELRLSSNNQQKISSMTLRLVAGDNKQDMVIESQCSLKVTVKKAGGEALQWCNVSVSAADNSKHDSQNTDAKGECEFHFLKEGDYTLTAYSQEGTQASQQVHLRRGGNEITIELRAPDCVKITWVEDEGEAAKAGLKIGDLVTAYNGTATPTLQKLSELVKTTDNTVTVSIAIIREGAAMTITAKGGLLGVHGDNHAR